MSSTSIFIGVVSFVGTRFVGSQGREGLGAQLESALQARGTKCQMIVDTRDRWSVQGESISRAQVQASLTAQLQLEDSWARYVSATQPMSLQLRVAQGLRWVRRLYRSVVSPGHDFLVRLLNIELAHRELLRQGIESGAAWIVILEDDAASADVMDLADGLIGLLGEAAPEYQFVNLSESFSVQALGIQDLLVPGPAQWQGRVPRHVLVAERPVTNTVCAIAYRRSFAEQVLHEIEALPMIPTVPIDWKLNRVLMGMFQHGTLGASSCVWVVPGPIDQLSMRSMP